MTNNMSRRTLSFCKNILYDLALILRARTILHSKVFHMIHPKKGFYLRKIVHNLILIGIFYLSLNELNVQSICWALPIHLKSGKVEFLAKGKPSLIKIRGEGKDIQLKINKNNEIVEGQVSFNLNSLSTGIELRDKHMKEKYLQTNLFPEAIMNFKNFKLPTKESKQKNKIKAWLDLHGVKKEIEVEAECQNTQNNYQVHLEFSLDLSDFKINIPSYAGIKVADQVQVTADVTGE